MTPLRCAILTAACSSCNLLAAVPTPAPQAFQQEVGLRFTVANGAPGGPVQLIDCGSDGQVRALVAGEWFQWGEAHWTRWTNGLAMSDREFVFSGPDGRPLRAPVPWGEVRQVLRFGGTNYLLTSKKPLAFADDRLFALGWPEAQRVNQATLSPEGTLVVAGNGGLFRQIPGGWERMEVPDGRGRAWAASDVLGVAFDGKGRLWFASRAGVGCLEGAAWRFFEGRDGLPWNDFTGMAAGPDGEIWFSTHLGAIRRQGQEWDYRQGPLWLPSDDVSQVAVDRQGRAWFATVAGIGCIERRTMTFARKAAFYEEEIERYVKRTPFGFVAEAYLRQPPNKASADPGDTDNDGLWTAMYGAGECFAFAATRDPASRKRARQAFEALRFLQQVTQGGDHAPPRGYVARSIRSVDLPDPNAGSAEADREERSRDRLWKTLEPRWPRSADGKWFWKSDTSSDELDGHYFFYPLYFDFCADDEAERVRVRVVVRDLTDHLLAHDYALVDHDGKPTRWGNYGPRFLNQDPLWWQERGLKSLSLLSYLAVAEHVTGDPKYAAASRELIDRFGYAFNAMHPKVQHGPGSGNQSDDEMAFMCFYSLLRNSRDENLKQLIRHSFFHYWANEAPEMNPFFNFAYAAHNLDAAGTTPWGSSSLAPGPGWQEDSMATLRGFPLDRLDWPHLNSHRLDLIRLPRVQSEDLDMPDPPGTRGGGVNGKVLPVENRHFSQWNTDPWLLDYRGKGNELASGSVFLLPYYLGLYHGFIAKPRD